MAVWRNATPLIAIDAVVIDTETTGLDPRKARVLEVAGVKLAAGRMQPHAGFQRLVQPGEPIPQAATVVHGIDAAKVADAPVFTAVWPEFAGFIGSSLVIGHTVGFDLAIIKRECERAGLTWTRPRTLDTRLLAEIVAPDLADYSLESIAEWLEVEVAERHTAMGDATTAARILLALLPKLRDQGIRTLAEAERACVALTDALDKHHRAGWVEPVSAPAPVAAGNPAERVDSYPYRHRVKQLTSAPVLSVAPDASLATALARMANDRVSSLFVLADADPTPPLPERVGIITERDVMRALTTYGAQALQRPVGEMASRPLAVINGNAFAFLAMARMNRLRIRHLGVTDDQGRVVGALSARDLLRLRAEGSFELGDAIAEAGTVHDLGAAWARLPRVAAGLLVEGLPAIEVAALISHQLCGLTERAVILAEERLLAAGLGRAPCSYAFVVLGSAGRGESLLAMDQDNAVIFEDSADTAAADRWFAQLGSHVADILHEVGVPYCKGGVMAKNPQWRGPLSVWRKRIGDWVGRSRPQDLLSVDIFFDMRAVHGSFELADLLWREAFEMAKGQAAFAKLLLEGAGTPPSSFNLFGGFKTENGRIDLKRAGLFGIVTAARVLAIRYHVLERSTPARLAAIKALGHGGERDLEAVSVAQGTFLQFLLAQQLEDLQHGTPPSNAVSIKRLPRRDQDRLRSALKATAHLDDLAHDLLFGA
jgi:DNA polymerase-3 subunit epsilon/CBS domain-containing protein